MAVTLTPLYRVVIPGEAKDLLFSYFSQILHWFGVAA
jgi:hypothetical protein